MQTYYIINPRRGAEISFTKICAGGIKCPSRTKLSSTYLHLMMHIFMAHGVDPLVLNGRSTSGSTWGHVFDLLTLRWRAYENPTPTKQSAHQSSHQKLTLVHIIHDEIINAINNIYVKKYLKYNIIITT
jgi:hypothetical protein